MTPEMVRLIIAARVVAFGDQSKEAIRELDQASETFADQVPRHDDPTSNDANDFYARGDHMDGVTR